MIEHVQKQTLMANISLIISQDIWQISLFCQYGRKEQHLFVSVQLTLIAMGVLFYKWMKMSWLPFFNFQQTVIIYWSSADSHDMSNTIPDSENEGNF